MYGCSLPGEDRGHDSSYPKEVEGFLFAPSDITPWEAEGKDNMHGIGYRGIQDQLILGSRKATKSLYGMSGEVGVVFCLGWVWFVLGRYGFTADLCNKKVHMCIPLH